jgi:hypothetical protein
VRRFVVLSNNKPSSHRGSAWDQEAFGIDGASRFTKNSAIIIKVYLYVPERTWFCLYKTTDCFSAQLSLALMLDPDLDPDGAWVVPFAIDRRLV